MLENEYALIIMDVLMPEMDGFETAKRIKMRRKSRDIPIIFLTALTKRPSTACSRWNSLSRIRALVFRKIK
ncbi:response regulator [Paenibacillus riograndensis]|uniref:response regulator n=1 Tax=Paenibacillus riograndensis TaxID=483937 RepID=UPI002F90FD17